MHVKLSIIIYIVQLKLILLSAHFDKEEWFCTNSRKNNKGKAENTNWKIVIPEIIIA